MTGFDETGLEMFTHQRIQLQQAKQIRHRCAGASHGISNLLVRQTKFIEQTLEPCGLFNRVEIFTLNVFDQADGEAASSGTRRTTAGTWVSPAICAARQRRSPAISS